VILKSINLTNIRSYIDETIEFPLGTSLFEGDMGSGKSSILMAIEFALFGLGSEKGSGLLRIGKKEGSVSLEFEVDGNEYKVFRSLKRKGNSVQQGSGYLLSNEGKLQLAPSELKERILKILSFNEPSDPKAQSVIYRYAIFTPQEEMKVILNYKADVRLQTLRKAFMLEDYRIASNNAANFSNFIQKKAIELDGKASDLEEIKNKVKELNEQIKQNKDHQLKKETEIKNFERKIAVHQKQLKDYEETRIVLSNISSTLPHLENQIDEKTKQIKEATQEINEIKTRIKLIKEKIDPLNKIEKSTEMTKEALNKEITNLEHKERELLKEENFLKNKIKDYESVQKNNICPTCDSPIESAQFIDKINKKNIEKAEIEKQRKICLEKIEALKKDNENLEKYKSAQEKIQDFKNQLKVDNAEIEKRYEKIQKSNKEIEKLNTDLESSKSKLKGLKKIQDRIEDIESKISDLNEQLIRSREQATELRTRIKEANKNIIDFKDTINEKEKQKKQAQLLREYKIWIGDYFISTVEAIEKYALLSINSEFDQQYRKWYNLMIEDPSKESRIDAQFSPIIEQDGYEQNVAFLSGGEKTSVALSYRLALNNVVQKVSIGMKSNLLILDEPTDGFSKSQLFKMREIIDEIKCPQLIMVSHERELESFVDNVIKIEKSRGISKIINSS
jgi:exonuclease SbcC